MNKNLRVELLIGNPQNDFCDPRGALPVAGADKDMERLAAFVRKHGSKFVDITVTLDSHHPVHVAHPCFWRNAMGKNPPPFTIISVKDVETGVWNPAFPSKHLTAR